MQKHLFIIGWLLFVVAFFLPTAEGLAGWEAFIFSVEEGFMSYPFFSALTNLCMLATLLSLKRKSLAKPLSAVVWLGAAVNLYWVVALLADNSLGDLSVGFYVWWLSFVIVGVALWRMAPDK